MENNVNLTTYGEITLLAIANINQGLPYEEAWEEAVMAVRGKKSKPCARAAFIGLCRAGIIKGCPILPSKNTIKNRDYVINGLLYLEKNPDDVLLPPSILWKRITITYPVDQTGYQMDIAIALFSHKLYDSKILKQFEKSN